MAFLLSILANFLFHIMLQMPYISSASLSLHLGVGTGRVERSLHSPSAEDILARPRIRDCHLQFGNFALSANSSTSPPLPKLERARRSCNFCKSNGKRTSDAPIQCSFLSLFVLTWCFSTRVARAEVMEYGHGNVEFAAHSST